MALEMEEKLGSGAYGLVLKGIARGLFAGDEETVVAIKTLQPNSDITNFKALLIELKIMSFIGRNPYIVNLLGACTTDIRKRNYSSQFCYICIVPDKMWVLTSILPNITPSCRRGVYHCGVL